MVNELKDLQWEDKAGGTFSDFAEADANGLLGLLLRIAV